VIDSAPRPGAHFRRYARHLTHGRVPRRPRLAIAAVFVNNHLEAVRLISRNSSDNAVITGLSNLLFLFPRAQQCQARRPDRGADPAGPMTPERNRATQPPRDRPGLAVKQLHWNGRA
jgi:hypothetical protein